MHVAPYGSWKGGWWWQCTERVMPSVMHKNALWSVKKHMGECKHIPHKYSCCKTQQELLVRFHPGGVASSRCWGGRGAWWWQAVVVGGAGWRKAKINKVT